MPGMNLVAPFVNAAYAVTNGVHQGTVKAGECLSQWAYDVYDLKNEGFEKWVKAAIANLQLGALVLGVGDRFSLAIKDFEAQKDLYYATKVFNDIKNYSHKDKKIKWDWTNVKLHLYAIGNVLEALKFLKKQEVFTMEWANIAASRIGSVSVQSLPLMEKLGFSTIADVPVLNSLTRTPKDLFIFLASAMEVAELFSRLVHVEGADIYAKAQNRREFVTNIDNILKFFSSAGKMVLISCGKFHQTRWFVLAAVIANNASWFAYNRKCTSKRELRFNRPAAAAAAAA